MPKALVVFKERKTLLDNRGSFIAVYGELEDTAIGYRVGTVMTGEFDYESVSYVVRGIEGTWLEPTSNTDDIVVL